MKRLIVVVVSLMIGGGALAYATSVPVTGSSITNASAQVAACDPTGTWAYAFTKDANGAVTSVDVSGIAGACSGGRMSLTLVGPSSNVTGTLTTITGCTSSCTVTVPFPTAPFPADITSARAAVVGP